MEILSKAAQLSLTAAIVLSLVLVSIAAGGCATTLPKGFGEVPASVTYQCPADTSKVCIRPASELICECH